MISPQQFLASEEFEIIFKSVYRKYTILKLLSYDDCLQETALFMLKYPPKYEMSVTTWVYRAARNAVLDVKDKDKRRITTVSACLPDKEDSNTDIVETKDEIQSLLNQLTHKQKTSIVKRYFENADFAEIGKTAKQGKNRVTHAMYKMRKLANVRTKS